MKIFKVIGSLLFVLATNIVSSQVEVTFRVDMSAVTVSPAGVHLAGSFGSSGYPNWDPSLLELTNQSGSFYQITLSLLPGAYEYKFVNGNDWTDSDQLPSECTANGNRLVDVGSEPLIQQFCYSSCNPDCQSSVLDFGSLQTTPSSGVLCTGSSELFSIQFTQQQKVVGSYQWFYREGVVACPTGYSTAEWTEVLDSNAPSISVAEFSGVRTYACFFSPVVSTGLYPQWTSGCTTLKYADYNDVTSICLVTVDPATGNNVVVWEPTGSSTVSQYVVYKETNVANEYSVIGYVDQGVEGVFVDENSNSAIQASRYKLAALDTCLGLSDLSPLHKTIHLTTNIGMNNSVNLLWTSYEGIDVSTYAIYRGSDMNSLTLIASLAGNLNSYTDLTPLSSSSFYVVEIEGVSCDPSRSVYTSRSNSSLHVANDIANLELPKLDVYPNPAVNEIVLSSELSLIGSNYCIIDLTGKIVMSGRINASNERLVVQHLARGIYQLQIHGNTESVLTTKKIVLQ
jgi:Secretion system C-terminal sorting domain